MHRVSLSSSCSSHKRKRLSSVKKTTAVLKRATTEKSEKWKSRDWYGTTKTRWQQPARSSGGHSSHDAWDHAKPKGKWKEVSAEFDAVGAVVKERKTLGTRVARRARREKPNSTHWSKVRPRTKNKKEGLGDTRRRGDTQGANTMYHKCARQGRRSRQRWHWLLGSSPASRSQSHALPDLRRAGP